MIDSRVQAAVNLHAVLRALEDLVSLDARAAEMVRGAHTRVTFRVPGITPLSLTFTDGRASTGPRSGRCPAGHDDVTLTFVSARHFNRVIAGEGFPLPVRGFSRMAFLRKDLPLLTGRLEALLRPLDRSMLSAEERRISWILSAYIAFYSIAPVANLDERGRANAARMVDGDISVEVVDGPALTVHARSGVLEVHRGLSSTPRARMTFDSVATVGAILEGSLDTYAAIGDGRLAVCGYIPSLDNMNKLLSGVSYYLAA
ncbi:hypothetical protein [Austwickia chelonae]|uniref:hypothetical protein n=1 Tax=Austwickia chelonae TaxID=100225 RepID=UPI000E27FEDD|nr:hypothetical protein [Austwickia chelonae]